MRYIRFDCIVYVARTLFLSYMDKKDASVPAQNA